MVEAKDWRWFGFAGHFICGNSCRFHMTTQVGTWLVSTVGALWLERSVREIHAEVHDPEWLVKNKALKGDAFDHAYMKRFGFENVGAWGKYETMVFRVGNDVCVDSECNCGMPVPASWTELDGRRYETAGEATRGHYEFCEKWAALDAVPEEVEA